MKKLISIKEVRNLISVIVMLIAFFVPLFIIESIGFPRLVSGWFSVVIGLLTTAAISNWNTDYGTESEQPISQVLSDLRESIYMVNMCVIIFYLPIRFFISAFNWLKNGYWDDYTTCIALNLFCQNNTKYIGLNKIFDFFGHHDLGYLLSLISIIMFGNLYINRE
jgi:hypothetical protein